MKILRQEPSLLHANCDRGSKVIVHAAEGSMRLLEWCLAQGASPDTANDDGYSCLHGAINMANVKQLKTLLAAGANVHVKNKDGLSPLAYAVNSGKHGNEIFAPLLKAGADPNEVMPSGITVADLAKRNGQPLPI